jgi:hypothetical protein
MPSPFQSAGAAVEQTKSAALHVNRMFTGLWTQRNPLRDAATPYLYEKFYSATRYDSLLDGINMEVSVRLTLIRRPGSSVYNPSTFPPARRYYAFRTFVNNAEQIRMVGDFEQNPADPLDTYGTIREWTAPATNTILAYKTSPVTSSFLSIGNTLYWTDGAKPMEWALSSQVWQANTAVIIGSWFLDSNNHVQQAVTGDTTASINNIAAVQQSGSTGIRLLLILGLSSPAPNFTPWPSTNQYTPITLSGLTAHPEFNGHAYNIVSDPSYAAAAGKGPNQIILDITGTGAPFSSVVETGTCQGTATGGTYQTSAGQPVFNPTPGGITIDYQVWWQNKGSAVHGWGIAAPTVAPTVAQTTVPAIYPGWTASTVYSPTLLIVDSNGNIQLLTTGGTSGAAAPSWASTAGATTTDGTAVWTCQGLGGWVASTAYAFGAYVAVTFNTTVTTYVTTYVNGQPVQTPQTTTVTYNYFFKCTTAGTSGAGTPAWSSGIGITVQDGGVVWTAIGKQQHWTDVGPSKPLSPGSQIVDANGNLESATMPGTSGATAPTWQTAAGAITVDGTVSWTNGGPYSAAATDTWIYAYAYKNSVTGHVSTASPLSTPIVLGADNQVVLQGPGSTDAQVDTIVLYRTLQGGSLLFWMAETPAPTPAGSTWTYHSTQQDADLNKLIVAQINDSNDPPPAGLTALQYNAGRVWGFVVNTLVYTNGPNTTSGNGNDSWPPLNNFPYPAAGSYLWPTSIGLVVFTVSDMALVTGDGTGTPPFASIPFQAGIGLLSADAFGVSGSTAYIMTPNRRLLSLDPGAGELEVGFPVGDLFFSLYDPANCNVTWHEGKSADTALYVADNSAGWFRMSAISAPESGDVWAPRALIAGGTSAVRSLEVAPGQRRLIIGPPAGGGPILQRDDTVSQDNTIPFWSYGDIGCIVLAQPGQIAGVEFLTIDALKRGSRPQMAVLLGEVSGTFEYLQRNRQDPPLLPPSNTLYSDRFYMLNDQSPVWCRFMQIRVDFGTEDFPNELLTYTIFGSIQNEV